MTSLKWWISASMDWLMMCAMWSGELPIPSGPSASLAGQPILASLDHHRVVGRLRAREPVHALLDDPQRLVHLVHPDQVPAVDVALVWVGTSNS